MDVVRLYMDDDGDGSFDAGEPFTYFTVRIARVPNYVALGDSYSSGEAGELPPSGRYQSGISDADGECRRWDQAYPYVFARRVLGNANGTRAVFKTFACTGATTHNIYDPADPDGDSDDHHYTNRPSRAAVALVTDTVADIDGDGEDDEIVVAPGEWEPRQAVSLATVQQMPNVDMITLTVGGNDVGFGAVLQSCVDLLEVGEADFETTCTEDDLELGFQQVQARVTSVLERLKEAAPEASIFVVGYPHVTPSLNGCSDVSRATVDRYLDVRFTIGLGSDYGLGVPLECVDAIVEFVRLIENCASLSARDIYVSSTGWQGVFTDLGAHLASERIVIDAGEAVFLEDMADKLNGAILEAATAAGVHFVDVVGGINLNDADLSFVGHSPCNPSDAWLNGFVVDLDREPITKSDSSFHPNSSGQDAYADVLERYIQDSVAAGGALNDAGLPVNAAPRRLSFTGNGAQSAQAPQSVKASRKAVGGSTGTTAARAEPALPAGVRRAPESAAQDGSDGSSQSAGYLIPDRPDAAGCGAAFVAPGGEVTLVGTGFLPGATVSLSAGVASFGDADVAAPSIADVTADAQGIVRLRWTVPDAPTPSVDPAPRAYAMTATGDGAGGGTHTSYMYEPLVAYPQAAPCAVADTASTTLGRSVQVPVLANDMAPTAGSLDAASVRVLPAIGGDIAVDGTTGSVTFTPDAGFSGTVRTTYVVYDSWGIGVRGDIAVTVTAGCTITGAAGAVSIVGTDGDDVICVPDPEDRRAFHVIDAKAGNDIILGGAGVDWVYGGAGDDTVYGRGGDDRIIAGAGTDTVYGGSGMDHVYSADLDDTVIDDDGHEMVVAPAVTVPQSGPDASDDWHHIDVSQSVIVDVVANDHDPNGDIDPSTLTITVEPLHGKTEVVKAADTGPVVQYTAGGSGGSDSFSYQICDALGACDSALVTVMVGTAGCTIVGTEAGETLRGTAGDDVICGLGGDDTIYGLGGEDIIVGGAGEDSLYGGDATLLGATDGDDLLWGGSGDDTLYGGNGKDTLYGGSGDDMLYGNRRSDRIFGGDGDDTAVGGGENDRIFGGSGDDTLNGHAGDDNIWGGPGVDVLRGGNGDDTLWGGPGDDTLTGDAGADSLHGGAGDDAVNGNTQDDVLWGGPGDDTLDGKGHDDQLHGGPGDDTLRGGAADDRVYGGSGDDSLDGGNGTDHLDGGPDTDTCARSDTSTRCETEGRP